MGNYIKHGNKIIVLFALSLFLIGCSKGKLDYRSTSGELESCGGAGYSKGGKLVYLVNKSNDKKITFTIKKTFDSKSTSTETHSLNPGEEQLLGCEETFYPSDWNSPSKIEFEIVGELVENP
jgi:hypothetical protein